MLKDKRRHVLYLLAALAMLVYGLPRLELGAPWTGTSIFAVVWIGLALLVVAAHLGAILFIDEAKSQELRRIKQAKRRAWERRLQQAASGRSKRSERG